MAIHELQITQINSRKFIARLISSDRGVHLLTQSIHLTLYTVLDKRTNIKDQLSYMNLLLLLVTVIKHMGRIISMVDLNHHLNSTSMVCSELIQSIFGVWDLNFNHINAWLHTFSNPGQSDRNYTKVHVNRE